MIRLFVAAWPPQDALDDLAEEVHNLGLARFASENEINVRLTARQLWHVTLAFIGDVPDDRADVARDALASLSARPATVRIGGGGKFGRGRFTILWAGLRGDVDLLAAVSRGVRAQLKRARLPSDWKPFRPHVTLARPGDRVPASVVAADVIALNQYDGPEWTCDEVLLVSSHQGPKPSYEVLGSFGLT